MTPFKFSGRVIPGEKVGRSIGFPTANLDKAPHESELQPGVYAGTCEIIDLKIKKSLPCLIYFGPRYIFDERRNNFEVYIYDFNKNIYDQTIAVTLLQKLRSPQKTKNLDQLQEFLEKDKQQGLKFFKNNEA